MLHLETVQYCPSGQDADRSPAVELEDLVLGLEGAAAVDVRGARGLLEGGCVLADVSPPDIVQRALRMSAGSWDFCC